MSGTEDSTSTNTLPYDFVRRLYFSQALWALLAAAAQAHWPCALAKVL